MSTFDKISVLLPHVVKQNAQTDPDGVHARIPLGSKFEDGYKDVTKRQLDNAINYTASLIVQQMGRGKNFETLAYISPGDLRYSIVVVASIKAGYKVFLPSPRNSKEAHISLLGRLQCTKLLITEPHAPCVPMILGELPSMKTMILPPLQKLLEVENPSEFIYEKSFAEAKNDPAFVLHTSGSTGIPKPLIFTHEFISRLLEAHTLPAPEGYVSITQYLVKGRFFQTLPSFHIAGLTYSLLISNYLGSTPVYTLPGPPPSTESLITALNITEVDWAVVPPVVIDELGKQSDLLQKVAARLKYLFFTGGSAPKSSGDIVARKMPLWQIMGSSECGSFPLVHPATNYNNSEDWRFVQINPLLRSEMRHRVDDLHELVIIRNADTEPFQPVFTHFPEKTEYEMRDLFRAHRTKQGLWNYQSRVDDVIVFLNGEKTNPVTFEEEVISHPEVKAALVYGAQRLEAALLIELANESTLSQKEKSGVIDRIWPAIEKANKATPAHARISKNKILLVDPKLPMSRAGKGTVQRAATLALYSEAIERLYQQDEDTDVGDATTSTDDPKALVRNLVADVLGLDDLDFFQLGFDSLGALKLQRALRSRLTGTKISLSTLYSNPSVNALTKALYPTRMINGETAVNGDPSTKILAEMLDNFRNEIDAIKPTAQQEMIGLGAKRTTILLTGSTGALGSYVLHQLLSLANIDHIYCFNRSSNSKERQIQNHQARKLNTYFPPDRVTFLVGDLEKHNFGLSENEYQCLLSTVTHIVHNAWPVNFNLPLASFAPCITGVVSLVRFSVSSRWRSKIQFISSISSVTSYAGYSVPEAVLTDLSTPAAMGYGQSKYLAERLLDHASQRFGITNSSVRIGQIAGAAGTGTGWNRQEWLPSLVISSAFIGALPASLGDSPADAPEINWVPIDYLANSLIELAFGRDGEQDRAPYQLSVFQVVHPRPVSWAALLPSIKYTIETSSSLRRTVQIVPFTDWLVALKAASAAAEHGGPAEIRKSEQNNPAIKLLDFYETLQHQGMSGLRTKLTMSKTLNSSKTLRQLAPLNTQWVGGWVTEWMNTMED